VASALATDRANRWEQAEIATDVALHVKMTG
jgi:hypothetical protein